MQYVYWFLANRKFLLLLFVINLVGTIYGYIWYAPQLVRTDWFFWPFVPDSPTASLFFTIVLLGFLWRKSWGLMEALAIVTLFKYGIWAVVMNGLVWKVTGSLPWEGYMLMASHLGMAVQGLLYSPFYRIKPWHLAVAALWALHNEIIDYVFMQYPVYSQLNLYIKEIGYFTFWLSVLSIFLAWYLTVREKRVKWTLY
ncbi:DUF1405 domain-containing protein [Pseudobacillus badius]|uniref:DUF1405 domain-containing protein n=1 Tax=Bacillus badius TaxID=1455 RepID=UPI0007B07380|nr:DUF1405 domain-containing protein [Bacillus badius]KZN98982.1 hypothetical protein A4244_07755 [Bacillus badius]MED0664917.1 DUF1405 domain-containing protein [Bacillus badius]OCS83918.1 hypothetical protein A6M11_07765 [Bacillus badius]OVE52788.1 DUF1405 domain-containing protein [Bacillus badius]TDW04809.1 putative membrane protein YpjA [Bacillus badius]